MSMKRIRLLHPHEKHRKVDTITPAEEASAAPAAAARRHRCPWLPGDRAARARAPGVLGGSQGAEWAAVGAGFAPCGRGGRAHHHGAVGAAGPTQLDVTGVGCSRLTGDRAAPARAPSGLGGPQGAEWAAVGAGFAPCERGGRARTTTVRPGQLVRLDVVGMGVEGAHRATARRRCVRPARRTGKRVPARNGKFARRQGKKVFRATLLALALLDSA